MKNRGREPHFIHFFFEKSFLYIVTLVIKDAFPLPPFFFYLIIRRIFCLLPFGIIYGNDIKGHHHQSIRSRMHQLLSFSSMMESISHGYTFLNCNKHNLTTSYRIRTSKFDKKASSILFLISLDTWFSLKR